MYSSHFYDLRAACLSLQVKYETCGGIWGTYSAPVPLLETLETRCRSGTSPTSVTLLGVMVGDSVRIGEACDSLPAFSVELDRLVLRLNATGD